MRNLKPSQLLLIFFASVILAGTLLLYLAPFHRPGHTVTFMDSFFTATSAVCVTGLSTVDIATEFNVAGQMLILLLFQIGGLGYMTLATLLAALLGKVSLKDRLILREVIDLNSFEGIKVLLRYIMGFTLIAEGLGALVLTAAFTSKHSLGESFYLGVFHSVSAFNNCGLSLFSNSLEGFRGDALIQLTIMALIVIGGLGYIVLNELMTSKKGMNFSLHFRTVLSVTGLLLLAGTAVIFISEYSNPASLGGMGIGGKAMAALFQSVTARTAGFNTISIGSMTGVSLFFMLVLMFIGASPGGTGGGIKTTTFAVLVSTARSSLRGKQETNLLGRTIPNETVKKSVSITLLSAAILCLSMMLMLAVENFGFLDIMFEVVSALGTVGLSTGITAHLSSAGKAIIALTMFVGRLGPLTIGIAALHNGEDIPFKYPDERVLIG